MERIRQHHFTLQTPEIRSCLDRFDIDDSDLDSTSKSELKHFLEMELEDEDYENLVDTLFEEYGEEGDTFNVKVFRCPEEISLQNLLVSISEREDGDLMSIEPENFDYIMDLDESYHRESQGVVDLCFSIVGKREKLEEEEVIISTEESEMTLNEAAERLSEITDEEITGAYKPNEYSVETRIYVDAGLISITNRSDMDKTLQKQIAGAIKRWGKADD